MRHFARTVLAALSAAALVATFDATAAHADGMGGGGSSTGGGYARSRCTSAAT
ncbi:MAG: hypothetical protein JWR90_2983 [Marmoricola sp.]|jgi:hypothetical protein|nr:hypothetical protein [Marmoricola sp.]